MREGQPQHRPEATDRPEGRHDTTRPPRESGLTRVTGGIDALRHDRLDRRIAAQQERYNHELILDHASTEDFRVDEATGMTHVNPDVDPQGISTHRFYARRALDQMPEDVLRAYAGEVKDRVLAEQVEAQLHVLEHAEPTDLVADPDGGFGINNNVIGGVFSPDRQAAREILAEMPDETRGQLAGVLGSEDAREAYAQELWSQHPYREHYEHEEDHGY
jgi:hypothetical protein